MEYGSVEECLAARNAALISGDVEQMREYMIRSGTTEARKARPFVIEIAIHKARVHWKECPPDKLKESVWWLLDRHLDLNF